MSLKAFHLVFIIASVMLMLSISAWAFVHHRTTGFWLDLVWSGLALAGAVALLAYGRYFMRKLKDISYL